MRGFVVTGTDTGVGKTIAAAGLAGALGATYWKPIQAGLDGSSDSEIVESLAGASVRSILPEACRLATPCSPHEAARIDGVAISVGSLSLPQVEGPLIVEGAGGLMVPINDRELMVDLFVSWGLPLIMLARTSLGTINHSLLSIWAARHFGLEVAGILFVGDANPSSEDAIVRFGCVRHLGRLPWLDPLTAESLAESVAANVRLELLA